jgi:hypothetical protein
MTALKVVATDTASGATSNLLELWSGSTAALKLSVRKGGQILGVGGSSSVPTYSFAGDATTGIYSTNSGQIYFVGGGLVYAKFAGGLTQAADQPIRWAATIDAAGDVFLFRDAPNTLALRNSTAAQTFRVYNTYSNAGADYERLDIGWTSNTVFIKTAKLGGGQNRDMAITASAEMYLGSGNADRWRLNTSGHLIAQADNTYDIGASGANRPRNVYVADNLHASVLRAGIWVLNPSGVVHGTIRSESDGVFRFTDSAINNFNRLQFGNTTSSFPALKRVGTDLQVVIASTAAAMNVAAGDADLTFIEDRFRRKGAGSPEGAVTAPIGAVYHRTDGGLMSSFYVKESGTGNTGWVGK